jgi:hypothetical protein
MLYELYTYCSPSLSTYVYCNIVSQAVLSPSSIAILNCIMYTVTLSPKRFFRLLQSQFLIVHNSFRNPVFTYYLVENLRKTDLGIDVRDECCALLRWIMYSSIVKHSLLSPSSIAIHNCVPLLWVLFHQNSHKYTHLNQNLCQLKHELCTVTTDCGQRKGAFRKHSIPSCHTDHACSGGWKRTSVA